MGRGQRPRRSGCSAGRARSLILLHFCAPLRSSRHAPRPGGSRGPSGGSGSYFGESSGLDPEDWGFRFQNCPRVAQPWAARLRALLHCGVRTADFRTLRGGQRTSFLNCKVLRLVGGGPPALTAGPPIAPAGSGPVARGPLCCHPATWCHALCVRVCVARHGRVRPGVALVLVYTRLSTGLAV